MNSPSPTFLSALDLIISVIPPTRVGRVETLLDKYTAALSTLGSAEQAIRTELADLMAPAANEESSTASAKKAARVRMPRYSANVVVGVTGLRLYDTLVTLGAADAGSGAKVSDLISLIRGEKTSKRDVALTNQAVGALTHHGLIGTDNNGVVWVVKGRRIGYSYLFLPALILTRLMRLRAPLSISGLAETAALTAGIRYSLPNPSKLRDAAIKLVPFVAYAEITDTARLVSSPLQADPPVNLLPDEPGFVPTVGL